MSHKGLCRTAPATPGLLKIDKLIICVSYPIFVSYFFKYALNIKKFSLMDFQLGTNLKVDEGLYLPTLD